ncbi:plasmid recombination protein [Fusobacterium massiliense]|uniref:plasmid recombination protein n=1 Tax=Fusobacterium massiliense TaxID=1852365 RepID=UPI0028E75015|nr:plasmid recombination protein [Fusobacterium massiliense]
MGNSISVSMHIGSDKNAIKTMSDIKRCDLHNNRKYKNIKNEEIDLTLSKYNITLKGTKNIYTDMEIFYKTEFADALYKYNLKQQREDRKIVDYLSKMEKDTKTNIAVEILFQIGDKEDWKDKTLEEKQKSTDIFKIAVLELEKRNIKVVNAALHMDETSPHLHVIAVPVIEGQKRGLEKQVSQNKVITREVIKELREVIEKNFIEEYNRIYGTSKELKRGSEIDEHLQVRDYKNTKKMLEVAKKYGDKLELKEELENKTNYLTNELTKLDIENKEKLKRKNELEKTNVDLENSINNIDKENKIYIETLEKNKKNLETSTAGLTNEIKELESKFKEVKQIKEDKDKELELELVNKVNKIKEIEQIREEIKKLKEQQKDDEEKLKAEEKKRNEFLAEEETRKKKYEEIDAAIEKEKEKLKNKELELQKIKKLCEDTENARLKNENDIKLANKEIEDNKNILEKTNAEIKKLNEAIETAIKNKEKIEKEKQEIEYTKEEAREDITKLIENKNADLSIMEVENIIDDFTYRKNNKILNTAAEEIKKVLQNFVENVDGYKKIVSENFRQNIENKFGKSGNTKTINKNKYSDDIEY